MKTVEIKLDDDLAQLTEEEKMELSILAIQKKTKACVGSYF